MEISSRNLKVRVIYQKWQLGGSSLRFNLFVKRIILFVPTSCHTIGTNITFEQFDSCFSGPDDCASSYAGSAVLQSGKCKISSASVNPHDSGICNVHKSAWPPSSKVSFAQNSFMVPCTFMCLVSMIDGPIVTFSHSKTIEIILMAEDWQEGWEISLQKEDYSKLGYIGQGTSKHVIYVILNVGSVVYADV